MGRYGASFGAGIRSGTTLTMVNSTVSGNEIQWRGGVGGGLHSGGQGSRATLNGVTIAANKADDAANLASSDGSVATLQSTIVTGARGAGPNSAGGGIVSQGFNLEEGGSCGLTRPTDLYADAVLGPLDDYGGFARTMALGPSSLAIDAGVGAGRGIDQRGLVRPVDLGRPKPPGGDGSDIGAFEAQPKCFGRDATITARPGARTRGTGGRDVILGTPRADRILAGGGRDLVCSRGGADSVRGGGGVDRMHGGGDDDRLGGGGGRDRCVGGNGADAYRGCERRSGV
jgi:hypothetical protein